MLEPIRRTLRLFTDSIASVDVPATIDFVRARVPEPAPEVVI